MIAAAWLMLSTLLYSLQLNTGSFTKPLTEEEERYYLRLAKAGDLDARNVLIERNLRLVAHIMKKYYAQTDDQEDLISIGTIGLIKGIGTFDPDKGARLATYAARCVENATLTLRTFRKQKRWIFSRNTRIGEFYSEFLRTAGWPAEGRKTVSNMLPCTGCKYRCRQDAGGTNGNEEGASSGMMRRLCLLRKHHTCRAEKRAK